MVWVSIIMELEEMAKGGLGWADGVWIRRREPSSVAARSTIK